MNAVAYYRMSSDDQTVSIERQRQEVEEYARARGYRILGEYLDEAKSGSKEVEKRLDFQRLLKDSSSGQFVAVLCWNSSRFGRLDSIESAFGKDVLRKNGVHLETCKEGRIDWNTFEGRLIDAMLSELNHLYSRNLSSDTVSGRKNLLKAGCWPHGTIPYGYDKQYSNGAESIVVRRDQRGRKPKHWRLDLVVNEAEAEVVRWIFNEYTSKDISMRQVGLALNKRGVPSPLNRSGQGNGWDKDTVRGVLTQRAYLGLGHSGYARATKSRAGKAFNRMGEIEVPDVCPVLIDKDVWDVAQARLASRKALGWSPKAGSSVLSGVLVCGHCGYRMEKKLRKGVTYYQCGTATKKPHLGCSQWRVHEKDIFPVIVRHLLAEVDIELLKAVEAKSSEEKLSDVAVLEAQAEALQKRINKGTERYLSAPESLVVDIGRKLEGWKRDLEGVRGQIQVLKAVENETGLASFIRWWDANKAKLVLLSAEGVVDTAEACPGRITIRQDAEGRPVPPKTTNVVMVPGVDVAETVLADVAEVRNLLVNQLGLKVTLFWKSERHGKRLFHQLDKGRIVVDIKHLSGVADIQRGRKVFELAFDRPMALAV